MKAQPLTAKICHRCGYDLSGLPEDHRCPECGLRYDADTRSWRPSEPWIQSAALLMLVMYTGLPVLIWRKQALELVVRVLATTVLCFLVVRAWRQERKGILVAVHPEGVFIRDHYREEFFDWASIESLEVDVRAGQFFPQHKLHLRLTSGRRILLTPFFLWSSDKKAFAAVFGLARRRHADASSANAVVRETPPPPMP